MALSAYSAGMMLLRDERKAFDAAVRAWRERNPDASRKDAAAAVASIICRKL
jgi:hypothetical protein